MKKVFEIYIEDDATFEGFCGTVIQKDNTGKLGVTCFNHNQLDLIGMDGYFFPARGQGKWIVTPKGVVIDKDTAGGGAIHINVSDISPEKIVWTPINSDEISVMAYNALRRVGFNYWEELSLISRKEAKNIRGLGKKCFAEVEDHMMKHDISFASIDEVIKHVKQFSKGDIVIFEGNIWEVSLVLYNNNRDTYHIPRIELIKEGCYHGKALKNVKDIMSLRHADGNERSGEANE